MVYNTQIYWVFGLYPLSGILETRKQKVAETGSVSDLIGRRKQFQFPQHSVFYFLEYRTLEKVQNPSNSKYI
jgi:hypothetical protein